MTACMTILVKGLVNILSKNLKAGDSIVPLRNSVSVITHFSTRFSYVHYRLLYLF